MISSTHSLGSEIWTLSVPTLSVDPGCYICLGSYYVTPGNSLSLIRAELDVTSCRVSTYQSSTIDSRFGQVAVAVYFGAYSDTPLRYVTASVGQHARIKLGSWRTPGMYMIYAKNNTSQLITDFSATLMFTL